MLGLEVKVDVKFDKNGCRDLFLSDEVEQKLLEVANEVAAKAYSEISSKEGMRNPNFVAHSDKGKNCARAVVIAANPYSNYHARKNGVLTRALN